MSKKELLEQILQEVKQINNKLIKTNELLSAIETKPNNPLIEPYSPGIPVQYPFYYKDCIWADTKTVDTIKKEK